MLIWLALHGRQGTQFVGAQQCNGLGKKMSESGTDLPLASAG